MGPGADVSNETMVQERSRTLDQGTSPLREPLGGEDQEIGYIHISIYNRGPPSRSPGRLTPNPPGGLQLQKHFLTGTKFGTLFGASSEAPGEGFWVPFGGFLGPFLWSSPVGLRGM